MLTGRTNGLHDVENTNPNVNSFPVKKQNDTVVVVNPVTKKSYTRSLIGSGLSQEQIDTLSVTNAQSYQALEGETLYIVGGYGIDSATGVMTTKPVLTVIDVPKLIRWVKGKGSCDWFRQVSNPLLQVTGGWMWQANPHQPYLLVMGQDFTGNYTGGPNGTTGKYTKQIRPFQIIDTGNELYVRPLKQPNPLDSYRRRDLNVVPTIRKMGNTYTQAFSILSGVFTEEEGVWTVPIDVFADGSSFMPDPADPATFKQGMNNYTCANLGLFSQKCNNMYIVLFGGLSYLIVSDGKASSCNESPPPEGTVFTECMFVPFVNDVTTVRIDSKGKYQQYLMSAKFPTIIADFGSGKGGPIWYGTNAMFFLAEDIPVYSNEVINLDKLGKGPVLLGYITGGIASSVTFTNFTTDTQASAYVFKVYLERTDL